MPTFLWVGKPFQYPTKTVPTPAERLDKYCWNAPGNWKILAGSTTTGQQWVSTDLVPSTYQDTAYVGNPGSINNISGWEPAKCPLLFGGFSGGAGIGTWSHTNPGVTGITGNFSAGTTWTSSIQQFIVDLSHGWSFDVALGAGISGYALSWCMGKDSEASPSNPTSSTDYLVSVSNGFRDPRNPLRLKVSNIIDFKDTAASWYATPLEFSAGIGVPTEEFSETSYRSAFAGATLGGNSYTSRGLVFEGVKSWSPLVLSTGWSANQATVNTIVNFNAGHGQDLIINGGVYKTIKINTDIIPQVNVAPWDDWASKNVSIRGYVHGEIRVKDVIARDLEYAKCGRVYIDGGTAAKVTIHQFPYMVKRAFNWENEVYPPPLEGGGMFNTTLHRYWDQLSTYLTCGYSGGQVWSEIFTGITSAIPTDYLGTLELSDRVVSMRGEPDAVVNGVTLSNIMFDDKHYCLFGRVSRAYQQTWRYYGMFRTDIRQRVFVGGRELSPQAPVYAAKIPTINIKSSYDNVDGGGRFTEKWQPWQLSPIYNNINFEDVSNAYDYYLHVNTINNDGGIVLAPISKTLEYKIGQIYCKNHGTFDYGMHWTLDPYLGESHISPWATSNDGEPYFSNPNIYVGGLSGPSGDRLLGGFISQDQTAAIQVTPDYRLFNAAVLPNGTNLRNTASTWTTFTPTTTSE